MVILVERLSLTRSGQGRAARGGRASRAAPGHLFNVAEYERLIKRIRERRGIGFTGWRARACANDDEIARGVSAK